MLFDNNTKKQVIFDFDESDNLPPSPTTPLKAMEGRFDPLENWGVTAAPSMERPVN
jgi:hypothetical protein